MNKLVIQMTNYVGLMMMKYKFFYSCNSEDILISLSHDFKNKLASNQFFINQNRTTKKLSSFDRRCWAVT